MKATSQKSLQGRFIEDFVLGERIEHAVPKTLNRGERALYDALYSDRHAIYSSDSFARSCGLKEAPLNDMIVFHTVLGKSVPDLSLNAIANLGYAEARFLKPVFPGDTLRAESQVIGIKENSSRKSGIVWVRTKGLNQHDDPVLEFKRWVMVRKNDPRAPVQKTSIPEVEPIVSQGDLPRFTDLDFRNYDFTLAGEPHVAGDYRKGETIDHFDGVTIEEAEHMMATRLWHNTARVHFDASSRPDGRRLIYGGHVISLARSLSFNGLANAQIVIAINSGTHANPCFAGDTIRAWSEIKDIVPSHASGAGAIRIRTLATKGQPGEPRQKDGTYKKDVLLDLDYWCLIPN